MLDLPPVVLIIGIQDELIYAKLLRPQNGNQYVAVFKAEGRQFNDQVRRGFAPTQFGVLGRSGALWWWF